MNKDNIKNIIIGVLVLLLGLSLYYIGYDKVAVKENKKEETNNTQDDNNTNDEIDNNSNSNQEENLNNNNQKDDYNCSMCYEEMSSESQNVLLYFQKNTKLFTLAFELNGLDTFDVTRATIDDYFPFIYTYIEQNGTRIDDTNKSMQENELKDALEKYFDINNVDEIIEKAKTYTNENLNKENSLYQFHYNDNKFTISYGPSGYDYNYRLYDYHYTEDKDKVLEILKCNSMGEFSCKLAKKITITSDTYKIEKIENY